MKIINYKGFKFNVRHDKVESAPGNNIRHQDNAYLDNGDLVLKISKIKDQWTSAEIILEDTKKNGVYLIDIEKPRFLNKSIVAAVFLYQDDKNELDIEFTKWNNIFLPNTWITQQDPYKTHMKLSFSKKELIGIFRDKEYDSIHWRNKTYLGNKIDNAKLMISLWHYGDPTKAQIRIKDMHYSK